MARGKRGRPTMASGAGRRYGNRRQFQISDGFVDLAPVHEMDGTRRRSDRVARMQMADVFAGVTPAGGASPAPTAERTLTAGKVDRAISDLKFQTGKNREHCSVGATRGRRAFLPASSLRRSTSKTRPASGTPEVVARDRGESASGKGRIRQTRADTAAFLSAKNGH